MTPQTSPRGDPAAGDATLALGRAAVAAEADALWRLARALDARFSQAVAMLATTRQRVVVGGLGKSGHIARKIAATLQATGTPALFLHAGDAVHGDLGAIAAGDTVLLLSKSGHTAECLLIAARARTLGATTIAVCATPDSELARLADLLLLLPDIAEICPFEASPTTSATMMLALGDALAVATMRQRAIARDEVEALHPGGQLGRGLVPVARIMHCGLALPLVPPEMPMSAVLEVITAKGFGIAAVVDPHGGLLGVITDGDIRRHAATLTVASAAQVMTRDTRTIARDAVARDALAILSTRRITALMVVSGPERRVEGLIHVHDLLH